MRDVSRWVARCIVALRPLAAGMLLLAAASPLAASPCGHPADEVASAVTATSVAAGGSALGAMERADGHCGHCSLATCAAALQCGGQTHARPAVPHDPVAPEPTRLAPVPDRPGPGTTGPPPDTPPPQPRP